MVAPDGGFPWELTRCTEEWMDGHNKRKALFQYFTTVSSIKATPVFPDKIHPVVSLLDTSH